MDATRRLGKEQGWRVVMAAHEILHTRNMTAREATEQLDRLLRTARSWEILNVALFLEIEINQRRMTQREARRRCGWRPT